MYDRHQIKEQRAANIQALSDEMTTGTTQYGNVSKSDHAYFSSIGDK